MTGQGHWAAPVITILPDEIDMANCGQVRELLVGAAWPGVAVVVADLTNTTLCDSSGFCEIVVARKMLAAAGVDLRLAVARRNIRCVMEVTGLDQFLTVYPSVAAAIAASTQRPAAESLG